MFCGKALPATDKRSHLNSWLPERAYLLLELSQYGKLAYCVLHARSLPKRADWWRKQVLGQGGEGGAVRLPEIMQVSPVSQRLPVGSWPSVKDSPQTWRTPAAVDAFVWSMTFLTSFSDLARGGKSFSSSMWPGTRLVTSVCTYRCTGYVYC